MIEHTIDTEDMGENFQDWQRLENLEQDIATAWVKEGIALKTIRDEKLYTLRGYKTFTAYFTEYLEIAKTTVFYRIASAEAALNVIQHDNTLETSQNTFRQLSSVESDKQQTVYNKACELAVSSGSRKITGKHIDTAIIAVNGGYSSKVLETAAKWGFEEDSEKLNILQRWYERGSKNHDSKFWAVYHSGVLDPADEGEACHFASATVEQITQTAERWRLMRIAINSKTQPITGIVNEIRLVVDGMNVAQVADWQGKRVKITVKILDED